MKKLLAWCAACAGATFTLAVGLLAYPYSCYYDDVCDWAQFATPKEYSDRVVATQMPWMPWIDEPAAGVQTETASYTINAQPMLTEAPLPQGYNPMAQRDPFFAQLLVAPEGNVLRARLSRSSGSVATDAAMAQIMRRWRVVAAPAQARWLRVRLSATNYREPAL